MAIEFRESNTGLDCSSTTIKGSIAYIWANKDTTFFCGEFNVLDIEQILIKIKELQGEKKK